MDKKTIGFAGRGLRFLLGFFLLIQSFLRPAPSWAATWVGTELTAEAGIVMDVDTGAILFEKNGDQRLYPASTTKIMTALVVLQDCALDDMVTFSHDAVYNVERESSNAEIDEGDVLSVSDCLFALLLKSANEAANALAEHVAGSREAFAERMTAEAVRLGCTGTHFINPSGFYSEEHYTTVRDMALIGAAAMKNADFRAIDSQLSHTLAPTRRVPEGKTVYMEHKMMLQSTQYYDPRVVGGKTGYTIDCGNTLVTLAEWEGRRLVAVVLRDKTPYHYIDTKAMLNIGFWATQNQDVPEGLVDFSLLRDRLVADTVASEALDASRLSLYGEQKVSVPPDADISGLGYQLQYNLPGDAPEDAVARLEYTLEGRVVGRYYLLRDDSEPDVAFSQGAPEGDAPENAEAAGESGTGGEDRSRAGSSGLAGALSRLPLLPMAAGAAALAAGSVFSYGIYQDRKKKRDFQDRRKKRLEEMQISEEEFQKIVEEKKQQNQAQ